MPADIAGECAELAPPPTSTIRPRIAVREVNQGGADEERWQWPAPERRSGAVAEFDPDRADDCDAESTAAIDRAHFCDVMAGRGERHPFAFRDSRVHEVAVVREDEARRQELR